MAHLFSLALLLPVPLLCTAQETQDFKVQIKTRAGSTLVGTARLPATITVTSKYGDARIDMDTVTSINRSDEKRWFVATAGAGRVMGECSLGKLEVKTRESTSAVEEADLISIWFDGAVRSALSSRPVADPKGPEKKEIKVAGHEVRKVYDRRKTYAPPYDVAVLLSSGKHLALLDYETEECVFLDLATGTSTRVKVESSPSSLVEKEGKVFVANRKSRSLTVIDARTLKAAGRVPLASPPLWLTAPEVGSVLYIVVQEDPDFLQALDTKTGRLLPPVSPAGARNPFLAPVGIASVTPDNRLLITQSHHSNPLFAPAVFAVDGPSITDLGIGRPENHPGIIRVDLAGGRTYAGSFVYSLDLRTRLFEGIPASFLVPHPTKNIVFGAKRARPDDWGAFANSIVLFQEDTMKPFLEIGVGDDVLALVPTEGSLYVLGPTRVYGIPLAGLVPPPALAQPKVRRIPVDLLKPPSDGDVRKADGLVSDGMKAAAGGRLGEAKKLFEAALAIDPRSRAKAGLGMLLVREKKYPEAIAFLTDHLAYPFRDPGGRSMVYGQLGGALTASQRDEEAIAILREGLSLAPRDPALLKDLGVAYANLQRPQAAYLAWAQALAADPNQPETKNLLDDLTKKIHEGTKKPCGWCSGDGKFEAILQGQFGEKRKLIVECRACRGCGRTWKRPCVDCEGRGEKSYDELCGTCSGRGHLLEPDKGNGFTR